jgi:hypothetical protein
MPCNWQEATSETKVQVHAAELSLPTKTQFKTVSLLGPAAHRAAGDVHARASEDALLSVERQFVGKLASEDVSQQIDRRQTARDDLLGRPGAQDRRCAELGGWRLRHDRGAWRGDVDGDRVRFR